MPSHSSSSPDRAALQRVASNALQSNAVAVEKLSGYLFRTYRLTTTRGFFYLLRSRPSSSVRLLRHEDDRLASEAAALQLLGNRSDIVSARLIEYHSTTVAALGSYYLISGPFTGAILQDVEPSLSRSGLASIDRSLGEYVRRLSSVSGPAFGPLRQARGIPGSQSWARTFATLLETDLRDGEDALISLPYDVIRDLVRRHRASLDRITQPKLMILDLVADKNVAVCTRTNQVTGLLDFSTAFWGDPFMSDCFYRPTASFAEGFGKLPNRSSDERIRQYLYILYHASLAVIRQHYRPSEDNDELDARRDLTMAISQLSSV